MKVLVVLCAALLPAALVAQKQVLSIPFEFEKKFLGSRDYDAYVLDNKADGSFTLALKDNLKVQYIHIDKDCKTQATIEEDIKSSVLSQDISGYRGGTVNGQVFNFIYADKQEKGLLQEMVDFKTKKVTNRLLFTIPENEKQLCSFSDNNRLYVIAGDRKVNDLALYIIDSTGAMKQKRFPIEVPPYRDQSPQKLIPYLDEIEVIKSSEEPSMYTASKGIKLFSGEGHITLVVNKNDRPVHLFDIQLSDLTAKENFIDMEKYKQEPKLTNRNKSYRNGTLLFTYIYDKKSFRFAVHEIATGKQLSLLDINEASDFSVYALRPIEETRGYYKRGKPLVFKTFQAARREMAPKRDMLSVTKNNEGQYVLTAGAYMAIATGGGSTGGFRQVTTAGPSGGFTRTYEYDMFKYNSGGSINPNGADYIAVYFRVMLDSTKYSIVQGTAPASVPDQVKDYMFKAENDARATNQFAIGNKQYFGYYNKKEKTYVVEEIELK